MPLKLVQLIFGVQFVAAVVLPPAVARADDKSLTPEQTNFFEQKIRPLLIQRCFQCHAEPNKIKGGLRLDSRGGWEKGGDTGPALVREKPDDSLLIQAVRYQDADLRMPPTAKLADTEI